MASSWDSYYIVFLSGALSLVIPAVLALISVLFFTRSKKKTKDQIKELLVSPKTVLGQRINVRFFLAANAALILVTLALALVPCAVTLQSENRDGLISGLVSIVTLAGFAVLGLLYSIRKGDMCWLSSFHIEGYKEKKSE